jgi:hypothetical protein
LEFALARPVDHPVDGEAGRRERAAVDVVGRAADVGGVQEQLHHLGRGVVLENAPLAVLVELPFFDIREEVKKHRPRGFLAGHLTHDRGEALVSVVVRVGCQGDLLEVVRGLQAHRRLAHLGDGREQDPQQERE